MTGTSFGILFVVIAIMLIYQRVSLLIATVVLLAAMATVTHYMGMSLGIVLSWLLLLMILLPLNYKPWRRTYASGRLLAIYRKILPPMSRTEREAIAAGTVTWEADLFRGNPKWKKLLAISAPSLTMEEQAFIAGPVEMLCQMLNDWNITHNLADLPAEVWAFLKQQGFFGLIIPKEYGGKAFSAYAHSQIIVKISGVSVTASTTVSVPNSLGPAELLLHYGTEEQKNYYLPRLAHGEEIPCFALTSPDAGSDASAMTDSGIVCWHEVAGERTLCIRLNFDKRYITLAPIATIIGLAFKLYDPDHLLSENEEVGITCALIPRDTPGITIGRRHFPLNTPFQNGPIHGKDVIIPVDWVIGGVAQAGKGWRMLMECLSAGRAITLPSSALGGAKIAAYATGAYARIRKQFHTPLALFEGIEEALALIGAYTYIIDAGRKLAIAAVDKGAKPAIASAIVKYHATELARKVSCAAMDVHGGKAICLGPKNYLGRSYESIPIAITVEGANILTRNMIIFGQGAMRCHPYVYAELQAAHMEDNHAALIAFDRAIFRHIGFGISNVVRTFILGITGSFFVMAPKSKAKEYYQHLTRFSSAFALISDVSMLTLGGSLKRKESISARLGDILSNLYLCSAVLKQHHEYGERREDLPVVHYAAQYLLYSIQESFTELLRNYPSRGLAVLLNFIIFPWGKRFRKPKDRLKHKIAKLLSAPTDTRQRICMGAYIANDPHNLMADIQDAMLKMIAAEPVEKMIREAKKQHLVQGYNLTELAQSALDKKIITMEQFDIMMQAENARRRVISVDDFTSEELARVNISAKHMADTHG